MKAKRKILISIYYNPEMYPPTLNAIESFSKKNHQVSVVYKPNQKTDWNYPSDVKLIPAGNVIHIRKQEQASIIRKIFLFIQYCITLRSAYRKQKPDILLLYDPLPLLAYYLIRPFISKKTKIWYHNHDVFIEKKLRKYSISWLAYKVEQRIFSSLDIFSLPAEERKAYFPMDKFKGKYFFIPNFPRKAYFSTFKKASSDKDEIRIIFQGSIGTGHGIEELIALLPLKINNKTVKLILKGIIRKQFKEELTSLIKQYQAEEYVEFIGFTPYQEIPKIASSCHIGISIFTKQDVMNRTLGTASNKIYEYTAVGLPMLFYNDEHFGKHLGKMKWAIPVDLSKKSFIEAITYIDDNFESLSQTAREAFMKQFNFEHYFSEVMNHVENL